MTSDDNNDVQFMIVQALWHLCQMKQQVHSHVIILTDFIYFVLVENEF